MSVAPDLRAYTRIVVAFSGGKDSLAALLYLLALGVPPEVIELHHHDVDGNGPTFVDWPCTPAYVRALAAHRGLAVYFSWREGGFARELDRTAAATAPIRRRHPAPPGLRPGLGAPVVPHLHLRLARSMGDRPPRLPRRLPPRAASQAANGRTIHRALDVARLADRGTPFPAATTHADELAQAEDVEWRMPITARPWSMPAGAFGDASGPP